jgi:hypothetical protein
MCTVCIAVGCTIIDGSGHQRWLYALRWQWHCFHVLRHRSTRFAPFPIHITTLHASHKHMELPENPCLNSDKAK